VFKETNQQSVYERVGGKPYAALSEFTDTTSNPSQHADVYKLAIKDNCGNLTLPSLYHRTIHLQITPNIGTSRVLSWNNNLGYIAQSYVINRGHIGSMHPIDTIAGIENTYTDYPPANEPSDTLYRVDIVYSQPCNSTKNLQAARVRCTSNGGTNKTLVGVTDGINEIAQSIDFSLFPNPAKDILTVSFCSNCAESSKFKMQSAKLQIVDVVGKEVSFNYLPSTNDNLLTINIQHLSKGVYFVRLGNVVKKLVVE
jgi:hypothetical protein